MTSPANSIVASQITASGVVIVLMEIAKKVPWLPITKDTDKLNRWVAIIASGLVAAGIHGSYSWNPQTRIFGLFTQVPTLSIFLWGVGHWLRSYVFQQGMYKTYKLQENLPKLTALLEAFLAQQPPKP